MDKQIKLFLEFLENDKKVSSNTLQSYKRDILQYQTYIEQHKKNYLRINADDINEYFEYLNSSSREKDIKRIPLVKNYIKKIK